MEVLHSKKTTKILTQDFWMVVYMALTSFLSFSFFFLQKTEILLPLSSLLASDALFSNAGM